MGRIANALLALNSAKHAIREAINDFGGRLMKWSPLSDYPGEIRRVANVTYDIFNTNRHRVIFIDWDGTVLKDVMVIHGDPVTPPEEPSKWSTGLTFAGWTHTAEEMASVKWDMCIGATYTFKQYIHCVMEAMGDHSPAINVSVATNRSVSVLWGDGATDSLTSSNTNLSHTYTDGKSSHVITVYIYSSATYENASYVRGESTANYWPYKVFLSSAWGRTGVSGDYLRGLGVPVGGQNQWFSGAHPNSGRYASIKGFVFPPLRSGTAGVNVTIPRYGKLFLAKSTDANYSVTLQNAYVGSNGENLVTIPIADFALSLSSGAYKLIVERTTNVVTNGYYLSLCEKSGAAVNVIDKRAISVSGTLEGGISSGKSFRYDLTGLDELLATLPATETSRTITIYSTITDPSSRDNLLPESTLEELTRKGYSVAYSILS